MTHYWQPRTRKDHAGFCRRVAVSCFHRRRDYPLGSDERAHLMDEARRFLLWHRVATGRLDRRRTIPKDKLTAADIGMMMLSPQLVHNS
jgi:hypothetical protein